MNKLACALAALLVVSGSAVTVSNAAPQTPAAEAQPQMTPEQQARIRELQQIDASLHRQTGRVALPGAKVTLNLTDAYYFIGAEEAKKVLTTGWGNPPEAVTKVLGMIVPTGKSPFDDTWGAVITFEDSGYVHDRDAGDIKPDELLTMLRDGEAEENRQRQQAGFPGTHLAGWAQTPSYDPAHHALIWAKDITFTDAPEHTLNYDVRILGREGVLSVNIVSTMADLAAVRQAGESMKSVVAYNPGARYADFQEGDRKAAYGVAGLLAAGLGVAAAKKLGLLAVLIAFGKKAFVFILAGLGAVGAWLRKLFGGNKNG